MRPNSRERFNSKLVRLKGDEAAVVIAKSIMFQFQTGAIKSSVLSALEQGEVTGFNSKLVRLKGDDAGDVALSLKCFNSKLVRLKGGVDAELVAGVAGEFQFQTGAIKSHPKRRAPTMRSLCFNSKLVRLKAVKPGVNPEKVYRVSIPNWCD